MKGRMKKLTAIGIIVVLLLLVFFVPCADAGIVDIPDLYLEAAIRDRFEEMGIPLGTWIHDYDLVNLTTLWAWNHGIEDLTGLEYCVNLKELRIAQNSISDVSPLEELQSLECLDIMNNKLTDIKELAKLSKLYDLNLSGNKITDVIWLKGLANLERLQLSGCNITDLEGLEFLKKLHELFLDYNNIIRIEPLVINPGLTGSDWVYLQGNPLGYKAIYKDIPILEAIGVLVYFDNRTPMTLWKVSGDWQSDWIGFTLPDPFVVRVLDENMDPFPDVPVLFTDTTGGGSTDIGSTTTDLDGYAEATFTLGSNPGINTVIVEASMIDEYITFYAEATWPVLTNVLLFINDAVLDETLFGAGPGRSLERRMNAFINMLEEAERLIEEELIEEAYGQLREVYRRMDGESRPPDFVAGPAAPELAERIQYFMDYLIEQVEDMPDLVVSEIILHSDEISPGDILEYTYTVANIGGEGPDDDSIFDVATYLSTDEYFDADMDIELDWGYSAWEYHLDVGWSESYTENDVAIDAAPGTYYLIVVTDAKPGEPPNYYPGVVESNEDNNWRAIQVTVSEPAPE